GSTTTITTDPTPASTDSLPLNAFTTSRGTTPRSDRPSGERGDAVVRIGIVRHLDRGPEGATAVLWGEVRRHEGVSALGHLRIEAPLLPGRLHQVPGVHGVLSGLPVRGRDVVAELPPGLEELVGVGPEPRDPAGRDRLRRRPPVGLLAAQGLQEARG